MADSKVKDFGFHMQTFLGFRNPDYFKREDSGNIFLFQHVGMPMQWKDQALEIVSSVTLVKEPQAKEMPMQHSILLQLWKHLLFSSGEVQLNDSQKAYT